MDKKQVFTRTLGPSSAKFINELRQRGKSIFTLAEAAKIYGKTKHQTEDFIFYGGTAIKCIYFEEHHFSEDLDLIS